MKKSVKYISFALFAFMFLSLTVFATDANLGLECDDGIIKVFQIGGYALFIIKIIVPLLLMIVASVDMFKAVIGSDQDLIKKQTAIIIKRVIASLVIFLLPTIIDFAFTHLVNDESELAQYTNLEKCLNDPAACKKATSCGTNE